MQSLNIGASCKLLSDIISLSLGQEQVVPGCFLRARAIGLMPMIDQVKFSPSLDYIEVALFHVSSI
jgi:hypothetical protein